MKRSLHCLIAVTLMTVTLIAGACRPRQDERKTSRTAIGSEAEAQSSAEAEGAKKRPGPSTGDEAEASFEKGIERNTLGLGGDHPLKNLHQLASSLEACVGPRMSLVKASMLLPVGGAAAPDAQGRVPFLDAGLYAEGTDVLQSEAAFLLDPKLAQRYGVDADRLATPYLRALETVANVVAHNCEGATCACATEDDAAQLLRRCLPAFDPRDEKFEAATQQFAQECAKGPAGMRGAIASMLASYAFAVSH